MSIGINVDQIVYQFYHLPYRYKGYEKINSHHMKALKGIGVLKVEN